MSRSGSLATLGALFVFSFTVAVLGQDPLAAGQACLDKEDFSGAIDHFKAALADESKAFAARLGLARAYFGEGDYETAGFHADRAEMLDADNADALAEVGRCYLAAGEQKMANEGDPTAAFEHALAKFKVLAAKRPKDAEPLKSQGYLNYFLSRFEASGAAYEAAFRLLPKDVAVANSASYSYLLAANNATNEGEKSRLAERAGALAEKVAALAADEAGWLLASANTLAQLGRTEAANRALAAVLVGKADAAQKGQAAQSLYSVNYGKDQAAVESAFNAWAKAEPKNYIAGWWVGFTQIAAKNYTAAEKTWRGVLKISPDWAEAEHYLAVSLLNLDQRMEAAKLFKSAGGKNYNWPDPVNNSPSFYLELMGGTAFEAGRLEEAVQIFEEYLVPVCPKERRIWVLNNLGLFRRDLGVQQSRGGKRREADESWIKARDAYLAALEEFANHPELTGTQKAQLQNDTGLMFHYHFDDKKTALDYYKQALGNDKHLPDACLNVGRLYAEMGRLDEAETVLKNGGDREDVVAELARVRRMKKN